MAASFPNGTILSVSSGFGAAVPVTAISNANPAVATTATPPADGAIVVINSGWAGLTDRVARASAVDADSFALEGISTLDTTRFDAGGGAGSYQSVSGWVQLSQVRETARAGGEQQFFTWQYLEDRDGRQRQKPTFKNAKSLTVTLDYDPALAWYDQLVGADESGNPVALRAVLPSGVSLYYYVYPSFDGDPSMTMNENMTNVATFSMISPVIRYEAV